MAILMVVVKVLCGTLVVLVVGVVLLILMSIIYKVKSTPLIQMHMTLDMANNKHHFFIYYNVFDL